MWAWRALSRARRPLLDEPTAGSILSRRRWSLILKVQEEYDMASIVVTHDLIVQKLRIASLYFNEGNVLSRHVQGS